MNFIIIVDSVDYYKELQDKVLQLITEKFGLKVDKGGAPYIDHLLRVGDNARDLFIEHNDLKSNIYTDAVYNAMLGMADSIRIVGYLHDIIEDTDVTANDLLKIVPEDIVSGVVSVTRREGESYSEFIKRAGDNQYGRYVKLADLKDNMDITRLQKLDKEDFDRLKKYLKSYHQLNSSF